jgi:hypothetical protein
MKSVFKDPTAIKNPPKDPKNSPWNWECPQYDQRSSCFINAGTHYGVGHAQPVGTEKHSGKSAVPMGRVATMRVDEAG